MEKEINCWPFIVAKNTPGWILGFCIAGLAKNKMLGAQPPHTSCIKVRGYYFFLGFLFKKTFALSYNLIFFVYFLQLILLFIGVSLCRCFIYDSFFLYWVWLWLSFFFHIFEPLWNVHGGQITKTYLFWSLRVLKDIEMFSLHVQARRNPGGGADFCSLLFLMNWK